MPKAAHFGHLIFSCQLKPDKPDPPCLRRARPGFEPDKARPLAIDDRAEKCGSDGDGTAHGAF